MVHRSAMEGTGQLPKFADDFFMVGDDNEFALIPTAEVPLTNLHEVKYLMSLTCH